ncbi:CenG1A [Symbiodinium natans]|uniref:CenG1A protein n=1 Tax=Symbiodinium natans TaxID=878477 RepID=A0A812N5M5_9DINO|nr:CenG1A [Symbiodinium natans]
MPASSSHAEELQMLPGNMECADCGAHCPDWASVNHGVLICIDCAGTHRSLGAHISKVKSTQLDSWRGEELQSFASKGGNLQANALLTQAGAPPPPPRGASRGTLERYIRAKYAPNSPPHGDSPQPAADPVEAMIRRMQAARKARRTTERAALRLQAPAWPLRSFPFSSESV